MRLAMTLVLPVLGVATFAAPREVLVLEAGRSSTVIVLSAAPTSSAQFAALELQYHLEKITGEEPPIVSEPDVPDVPVRVAVGDTALGTSLGFPVDALQPWEFLVAERGGTIVLAGGDDPVTDKADRDSFTLVWNARPNGTCRAVFEFLEQFCEVHWYLPSEAGMVFPKSSRLAVRMDEPIRRATDFKSTSYYPYQVNRNMYCQPDTPDLPDLPDSDMEKWRRHLWTIPVKTTDMLPVADVLRWLLRNKVGGQSYGPNHSFNAWLEKYGLDHPDWFSYKSKERIAEILAGGDILNQWHQTGEPCFTAPGMFEQVLVEAGNYLKLDRARFFPMVPNDNYIWCQCPTCKPLYDQPVVDAPIWGGASGRASSYVWGFANRLARGIREERPDGWTAGIAYHDYMVPPKDFTLEPNVAVTICTYLGNWTPALRDTVAELVEAWRDDAKCQWIGLWEYFCYSAMSQYQPMFPKVAPRLLGRDVKRMYDLGVKAEFIESEEIYRFADAPERFLAILSNPIWLYLNTWTRFKMWDDTTRDVDQLLSDHYRLFYGPAAEPIQRFFDRIENRITDMSLRGPKTFNDLSCNRQMADWEYLFPASVMQELRTCVDEATALATDAPFRTRVTWVREGFLVPQERALARYEAQKAARPAQRPRETVCYKLSSAPTIDGDAGDAAWTGLPMNYLNGWQSGKKPKAATWFRLGYDDANLYLLARCEDPNVATLRANTRQHDGAVYTDDCIELHLSFDRDRRRRYQIVVNSRAATQDLQYFLNEFGADISDMTWDCAGLVSAATVDDKGWTAELQVPLASVGGRCNSGTALYANVAREKYSASPDEAADEMQAWSRTQGSFASGKHFGKIMLTDRDGFSLYFNEQTPPPAPVLLKVDKDNPWTVAPDTIRATVEQDRLRLDMASPQVDAKEGRTYAGFSVQLDPPVDALLAPYAEVAFSKPDQEVLLELIYYYVGVDGKDYSNYFILSTFGEPHASLQLSTRRWTQAHEAAKPAARQIKGLTLYAVVEGARTPRETSVTLERIRLCKDPLHPDE